MGNRVGGISMSVEISAPMGTLQVLGQRPADTGHQHYGTSWEYRDYKVLGNIELGLLRTTRNTGNCRNMRLGLAVGLQDYKAMDLYWGYRTRRELEYRTIGLLFRRTNGIAVSMI
jgi:hypothetical protein